MVHSNVRFSNIVSPVWSDVADISLSDNTQGPMMTKQHCRVLEFHTGQHQYSKSKEEEPCGVGA